MASSRVKVDKPGYRDGIYYEGLANGSRSYIARWKQKVEGRDGRIVWRNV